MDPGDLPRILGYIGNHFPDLYEMLRKLVKPGGLLFYNMTSIISYMGKSCRHSSHEAQKDHKRHFDVVLVTIRSGAN